MKFGQLIEYNMRNIFLEKSYTNMVEKLFTDPIEKLNISLDKYSKVLYSLFSLYSKLRTIAIY